MCHSVIQFFLQRSSFFCNVSECVVNLRCISIKRRVSELRGLSLSAVVFCLFLCIYILHMTTATPTSDGSASIKPKPYFSSIKLNLNAMTSYNAITSASMAVLGKLRAHSIAVKVVGTIAALLTARSLYCKLQRKWNRYPPGPIGIPFFGSLFSMLDTPGFATYLASNYGSVTMVYVGKQPFVFLHSIDAIASVFNHEYALEKDWHNSFLFQHLKPAEMNIGVCAMKYWKQKRRIFQSILTAAVDSACVNRSHNHSLQTQVCPSIDRCIAEHEGIWDFSADVGYIQFHTIWHACFGTLLPFESAQRRVIVGTVLQVFADAGLDVVLRSVHVAKLLPRALTQHWFPSNQRLAAYMEAQVYEQLGYDASVFDFQDRSGSAADKRQTEWDQYFAEHVQNNAGACAAAKLIHTHRRQSATLDDYDDTSSKAAILSQLSNVFLAGVDTSIHTTEYGLVLLAKNPEIQEQLYLEVRAVFAVDIEMQNINITQAINQLHLLRAFVQELVRISAIAATAAVHSNTDGPIYVKGRVPAKRGNGNGNGNGNRDNSCTSVYKIPRGSVLLADLPSANRRDPYWVRRCNGNPMEVCLDAWLDHNRHFKLNLNKDKNLAFGAGKRDCPGKAMALRSIYVLFAKLMLRYRFALPEDISDDVQIKQKAEFTFVMKPKIHLKVTKRTAA